MLSKHIYINNKTCLSQLCCNLFITSESMAFMSTSGLAQHEATGAKCGGSISLLFQFTNVALCCGKGTAM